MDELERASLLEEVSSVKNVFGGIHVSGIGAPLMERFPEIDYLVLGEGEVTLLELVQGRSPRTIEGLVWRDGEVVVANPLRGLVRDLDSLPFPAYQKLKGFPMSTISPMTTMR